MCYRAAMARVDSLKMLALGIEVILGFRLDDGIENEGTWTNVFLPMPACCTSQGLKPETTDTLVQAFSLSERMP